MKSDFVKWITSVLDISRSSLEIFGKDREDLVHRRFQEPAMQSIMKDTNWKIITYKALRKLYRGCKRKQQISLADFESHTRNPLSKKQKEQVIQRKLM